MYQSIQLNDVIVSDVLSRSPWRRAFILIPLLLLCFVLSPTARAVSPPPDGGYANQNTAEGTDALFNLTIGLDNTAIGFNALFSDNSGCSNTAIGFQALFGNEGGEGNTASGYLTLFKNRAGSDNTASGDRALFNNRAGDDNTATGAFALSNNRTASDNTATGAGALERNTIGDDNTATGLDALGSNTTGFTNTADGLSALQNNTTGSFNTASGWDALVNGTTGNSNIAFGASAGAALTTGSNNIDIGNVGVAGESNHIRIGTKGTQKNTFIAGISGVTVAGGVGVIIDNEGRLGTVTCSEHFKDQIKPMDKASEAVLALKPVTFRYKHELDPDGIPQFGLIAEQVEKVNPDLVVRGEDGKVMTVRYEAVNAMLLNEFLKEHRKVEEQRKRFESKLAEQQKQFEAKFAAQQEQIETLSAGLEKVSARLELNRPPQTVVDSR